MADPILHSTPTPGSAYLQCCFLPLSSIPSTLCTSDPSRVTCPGAAPMSRESLYARVFDLIRRSGMADGERLIAAMEADAAEIARCLEFGRNAVARLERGWREAGRPEHLITADGLRELVVSIDRAIAGKEIGPPKPASEAT